MAGTEQAMRRLRRVHADTVIRRASHVDQYQNWGFKVRCKITGEFSGEKENDLLYILFFCSTFLNKVVSPY